MFANHNKYYLRALIKKCFFSTSHSFSSKDNIKKIQEFRKLTNLSFGICKNVLNKNNYNIENSINYIFQNFRTNFENKKKELTEGYYCLKLKNNQIGLIELNCYNDLISENIFFKELLVNLCNNLIEGCTSKKISKEYWDKENIPHYLHLFYKDNKTNVDKKLENVNDTNIFKHIYFNRSINQLINYTSLILNDYIFLRKYLTLNLDNIHKENAYIIKNYYYHKELRIEDFILCKGFSFAFLFIKSKIDISENTKHILEKLSFLICVNILMYKPNYCSISYEFNIFECFKPYFNSSYTKFLGSKENKRINELSMEQLGEIDNNKQNVENTDDLMKKNVQAIHILSDCLEKGNYKTLNSLKKKNITFFELITLLEEELNIKIYTKIIYSLLNEDIIIL
ncbi:conserved Plasmodium protein, unknown function [Plasmodium gallinaceum]|uniref:Elongation factor Ts, mitochondrial n=1 Tax=Plasmodium gallinaceum TaxID=5849 RepID=A0A1J1GQ27_PLAGA|nr:conserved Plasmodium protein, unknown function [Plasmodium gallinaceum]CRG94623.1 conserved Plasmodium protein, unknown function [Plasmodium gallinaceum]